ncbi:MAG TPA: hypothetical protein DCE55_23675 [Planctomycetaceae bacterium]|nr:hypothetical protein [Planctomycetaceae bacterium]|tara:strand:+ start:4669 stop:5424 length:756 start_codon:yes stop_codon:yes gene_type:complete
MENLTKRTLVRGIAQLDAVYLPVRAWMGPLPQAAGQARLAHQADGGIPWRGDGGDERERKRRQRALEELETAGLIELSRSGTGRTGGIAITPKGDLFARAIAGQPGLGAALATLEKLLELERHPDSADDSEHWIPETLLAGADWDGSAESSAAFIVVEQLAMPAIVRQWVKTATTICGHAWFSITGLGREIQDRPPKAAQHALPPTDIAMQSLYERQLQLSLGRMKTSSPTSRELGLIPLPVSLARKGHRK